MNKVSKSLTIRRAGIEDIEAIKAIETDSGLGSWSRADYIAETEREDSIFLVVTERERVAGFVLARLIMNSTLSSNPEESKKTACDLEIYNIAIDKVSRNNGLGSKLFGGLLEEAEKKRVGKIFLEVRRSNYIAKSFYLKQGFKIIGERRNFYSNPLEDAILMRMDVQCDQNP